MLQALMHSIFQAPSIQEASSLLIARNLPGYCWSPEDSVLLLWSSDVSHWKI